MSRTNKDILLALVGTLTDDECRDVYYFITDKEYKCDYLEFDLVKLTREQYNKLIWLWGEDKTHKCIKLLNDWLSKKTITKKISHYRQLVGWVERKYYQEYPADDNSLVNYGSIKKKWQAKKYIQMIPKDLRAYDSQVRYLVEKYGFDIMEV